MLTLETSDLILIAADQRLAQAAVDDLISQGDTRLSRLLGAAINPAWPPDILADAQEYFAQQLHDNPDHEGWWLWYVLRKATGHEAGRELIGAVGFAGPVDHQNQIQIGFAIVSPYQNCGYATQAAQALIDWAMSHANVDKVTAQTYPELKASVRVLEKIGMNQTGVGDEPGTLRFHIEKTDTATMKG